MSSHTLWRRDDWTNLAQKVLKALLFFLPSVWWIERRLSLDREMACDDAVLARSGTPREYAECLAHVAERSFLRRQLALAQAAVGRVRQLTARVAMILEPNRPSSNAFVEAGCSPGDRPGGTVRATGIVYAVAGQLYRTRYQAHRELAAQSHHDSDDQTKTPRFRRMV